MSNTLRLSKLAALLLAAAGTLPGSSLAQSASAEDPPPLLRQMQALENAMTEAFNRCELDKLAAFYDPALEFYHDAAGVTWTRDQFIENVRKNACHRFTRKMLPGTLEAWPLGKFGALYTGSYQACAFGSGKCLAQGRVVMIVKRQPESSAEPWVITRVVSYDHKELP